MLLQKRISIEEAIVKFLARKVNLSVKEIISCMNQEGLSFSQRGVYKELNKLEEQGILLKSKYGYSL
jgi:Fe2+ or Zn2+ uptake regulation protein